MQLVLVARTTTSTINLSWTETQEDHRVLEEAVNMIEEQRKNTPLKNCAFVLLAETVQCALSEIGGLLRQ